MKQEIKRIEITRDIPHHCYGDWTRAYALIYANGVYQGQLETHYLSRDEGKSLLPRKLDQLKVLRDHLVEVVLEMEKVAE